MINKTLRCVCLWYRCNTIVGGPPRGFARCSLRPAPPPASKKTDPRSGVLLEQWQFCQTPPSDPLHPKNSPRTGNKKKKKHLSLSRYLQYDKINWRITWMLLVIISSPLPVGSMFSLNNVSEIPYALIHVNFMQAVSNFLLFFFPPPREGRAHWSCEVRPPPLTMQDELIIFRKYIFEFNYISPLKIARQHVQELWEIISFSHRQTDSQLPFSPAFSIICLQLLTNLQQPHITDTPVTLRDAQGHKVLQVTVFFFCFFYIYLFFPASLI